MRKHTISHFDVDFVNIDCGAFLERASQAAESSPGQSTFSIGFARDVTYNFGSEEHSNEYKGAKPLGDIAMNSPGWTRSGLVFKISQTIQEPVLVVLTHQGCNRYEYAGIPLY